jgi:hypothetical protein
VARDEIPREDKPETQDESISGLFLFSILSILPILV